MLQLSSPHKIFDVLSREISTLVDAELNEGEHIAQWDGRTTDNELASSGVYFYRLEFRAHRINRKMLFLR